MGFDTGSHFCQIDFDFLPDLATSSPGEFEKIEVKPGQGVRSTKPQPSLTFPENQT